MIMKYLLTESVDIEVDDIIKVGKFKWKVFRKEDDYTYSVYKFGTKGRKMYKLVKGLGSKWSVSLMSGGGQIIGDKPVTSGTIKTIEKTKRNKKKVSTQTTSLPDGFDGFGF